MNHRLPIIDPAAGSVEEADGSVATTKFASLREALRPKVREGALVAFSGGMDSAFLLWAAHRTAEEGGGRVVALTTVSPSTPSRDRADAETFARMLGVEHIWEESLEMLLPEYARNDRERCYHCKTELFRIASRVAKDHGLSNLLYGYNATDHGDDRPGHRAALEAGALTPLSDAGLTKPEIALLMHRAELPLSGKPASPCLSSRIMTGIEITSEKLADVQAFEDILDRAGIVTHRVRICREDVGGYFLRIEVPPVDMAAVIKCREELLQEGTKRGYRWVNLDLGGYRTGGGTS